MGELMSGVVGGTAGQAEASEFHRLWIENVMMIFESARGSNNWLKIEDVR